MMKRIPLQRGAWFALLLVFLLAACGERTTDDWPYGFEYHGSTMGTTFSVKVTLLPATQSPEALKAEIDALLREINQQMSTYLPDSELSRFNSNRSTDWIEVSPALYTVVATAQQISQLSDGAFDITVGPLVNLWGFGPDPARDSAPPPEHIDALRDRVGYRLLALRENPPALKKQHPEMYLDLSALAKGYGVDRVAALLESQGMHDYLVEIGGELKLHGLNARREFWHIAIEKPTPEWRMVQKIVPLTDIGVATSGDYRNYFEQNGKRYSHTIDPATGYPITHTLASVTLLAPSAMLADAWATAMMVLGAERGMALALQQNLAAYFLVKRDEGFAEQATPEFQRLTRQAIH